MKRYLFSFLLMPVLALGIILPACGGDDGLTEDGKISLTFYGWGSLDEQENYTELVNYYNEHNTMNVRVRYRAVDETSFNSTLSTTVRNYDVFYMPDYSFYYYVSAGRLQRLDDSSLTNHVTSEETEPIWDKAINMYRYDSSTQTIGTGALYGLPKDLGPYTLVYNKDLLNQIVEFSNGSVSLPSGNVPMTFTELTNYLVSIQDVLDDPDFKEEIGKAGTDLYAISSYEIMPAVYSNNSDFYKADNPRESNITDKNFTDAIQFIADLNLEYGVMPDASKQTASDGFNRFLSGNCVFTNMGPWDMKTFWASNFDFDIIPVAKGDVEGAKSTAWVGSVAYCISPTSRHKEEALDFIKFLALDEYSNREFYELGQAVPNIEEMAKTDFVNDVGISDESHKRPENKKLFVDIISGDNPEINGKNRAAYYCPSPNPYNNLLSSLTNVWTGEETAAEWASRYNSTFQADLDTAYRYF